MIFLAKNEKNKKSKLSLNTILLFLILICVIVIIILLIKNGRVLTPDYAPGEIDVNAIKEKDTGEKMELSGGGAVSLSYSNIVSVALDSKKVKLYFKNPSKSRENVVLEIVVKQGEKEVVIAKSDIIPTGYAIYEMNLNKNVRLAKGGYNGLFKVIYYDEETNEKQIVNTQIDITIDVK